MKKIRLSLLLAVGLCAVSCIKRDLNKTSHPDQTKIILTTDWSLRNNGLAIPSQYDVIITGNGKTDTHGNLTESVNSFLVNPDKYEIFVFNNPANITIDRSSKTATVNTEDNGYIKSDMGVLYSKNITDITATKDSENHVTAMMDQQVCRVDFVIETTNSSEISEASIEITGISSHIDLKTDQVSAPMKAIVPLTKEGNNFTGTLRMLGIDHNENQNISLSLKYKNGSNQALAPLDVTSEITGINNSKAIKRTLNLKLTQSGLSGSIIDWEVTDYKPEL